MIVASRTIIVTDQSRFYNAKVWWLSEEKREEKREKYTCGKRHPVFHKSNVFKGCIFPRTTNLTKYFCCLELMKQWPKTEKKLKMNLKIKPHVPNGSHSQDSWVRVMYLTHKVTSFHSRCVSLLLFCVLIRCSWGDINYEFSRERHHQTHHLSRVGSAAALGALLCNRPCVRRRRAAYETSALWCWIKSSAPEVRHWLLKVVSAHRANLVFPPQKSMDKDLCWAISKFPLRLPPLRTYTSYLPSSSSSSSSSITLSCRPITLSPITWWPCIRPGFILGQLFFRRLLLKSPRGGKLLWKSPLKEGSSMDPLPRLCAPWPPLRELTETWEPQWCSWMHREPDEDRLSACRDWSSSDNSPRSPDIS